MSVWFRTANFSKSKKSCCRFGLRWKRCANRRSSLLLGSWSSGGLLEEHFGARAGSREAFACSQAFGTGRKSGRKDVEGIVGELAAHEPCWSVFLGCVNYWQILALRENIPSSIHGVYQSITSVQCTCPGDHCKWHYFCLRDF